MDVIGGGCSGGHRLFRLVGSTLEPDPVAAGRRAVASLQGSFAARNEATAGFLRALHTAGRATRDGLLEELDAYAADEVAAGIGWSRTMAGRWLSLADDLILRLPAVLAAMEAGELDEHKARALSEWTRDLSVEHATAVVEEVLPTAHAHPLASVIERLQEVAIALDPQWAARREARAKRHGRVALTPNPTGTATLAGYDLPADEAQLALDRVEGLAATVRARGIRIPIALLRSIIYLRLLDGFCAGLDDALLTHLLVEALRHHPDNPDRPDRPTPTTTAARATGLTASPARTTTAPTTGPGRTTTAPTADPPGEPARVRTAARGDPTSGPDPAHPDGPGPPDPGPDLDATDDGLFALGALPPDDRDDEPYPLTPPPTRGLRRGTTELRLRLSTALGLDQHPARIPGHGPLTAPTARRLLQRLHHGEWRLAVTDDTGHLRHVLLTRHRPDREPGPRSPRGSRSAPSTPTPRPPGRSPAIVELQVPLALLAALRPADHPQWARLLTAAQRRLPDLPADGDPDPALHTADDTGRRRARAELDRWTRTRDRHCVGINCRLAARRCDLDHTRSWARHGPTISGNLGALCGHHHRAKHHGGWDLRQPRPGHFGWTSRVGLTYTRPPRPITEELPRPLGRGVHRVPRTARRVPTTAPRAA